MNNINYNKLYMGLQTIFLNKNKYKKILITISTYKNRINLLLNCFYKLSMKKYK